MRKTGLDQIREREEKEKEEVIKGLQCHIALEKEAIDKANKILGNVWIRETKGLKELIKKWRNDEKEHHKALKRLAGMTFFRISDSDYLIAMLQGLDKLEERYMKY